MEKYFYKYRDIGSAERLEDEYSLKSLLSCEAKFSNRHDFNDLFDSKINIIKPTPKQIKLFKNKLSGNQKKQISELIKKGEFTVKGEYLINLMIKKFEEVIDSYYFYCLSSVQIVI